MKTDAGKPDSKAKRKVAAAAGHRKSVYEDSKFGRRRVGTLPRSLVAVLGAIASPFRLIYRRLRGSGKS